MIRSLWAMVQGDPKLMRRINGWLTVAAMVLIPLSLITGWISSVVFVAALSIWALVSGHWSAWQAARVEVKQDQQESKPVRRRTSLRKPLSPRMRPNRRSILREKCNQRSSNE